MKICWASRAALCWMTVFWPEPGRATAGPLQNVASARAGATAIADSEFGNFTASLAIDGKAIGSGDAPEANRWHAALGQPHPHWLWIRFRQSERITKVVIHRADIVDYPVDFVGEFSPDGGLTFTTLFSVTNNQMTEKQFAIERSFPATVTDNFRVRILQSSYREHSDYAQLSEVEVFGEPVGEKKTPQETRTSEGRFSHPELKPTETPGLDIIERDGETEFRSKWLRLSFSKKEALITALCWDSLGEGKVDENLLKPGPNGGARLGLTPLFPESTFPEVVVSAERQGNVVRYWQQRPGGVRTKWEIRVGAKSFEMAAAAMMPGKILAREPLSVEFAFDVNKTPVAPLANPKAGATAPLPCLLHAADFGSLLVRPASAESDLCLIARPVRPLSEWNAAIETQTKGRALDGLFTLPESARWKLQFSVEAVTPMPALASQEPRLQSLPRSWLNTFQYKPDLGILANNVVSDNAVFCMFTFTDPAVFTPTLPGKIEAIQLARESLDRYFAGANGYGMGQEDVLTDTYPSLFIAAWDVIRVTGDRPLLQRWLPILERLAVKAEAQDRNGDGLPESTRSGLLGATVCPTGNWWDQINFGHEDAYVCALSYRAFRGLADLERMAKNSEMAARFDQRADRIRAAYVPAFFNPKTGILAGWKDTRGNLHDYWFIFVNGIAITYGLVPDALANAIVDRIEVKMKEVGYTRFDLGLPGNLVPIPKADYGAHTLGSPQKDDGTDTFGVFENGGASGCYAYFYVQALYQLGRRAEAERILWPMMKTFAQGGFQNGVGHGGEWRHWDGQPSGYEGFLADAYYAQLAVWTGHYGIGFHPEGFRLESWSPLKGKSVPLGLNYMGKSVKTIK